MTETRVEGAVYLDGGRRFSLELAVIAARTAADKKAVEPKVMDVGSLIGLTDYFVICSASNDRQIRTIVEEIERSIKSSVEVRPRMIEGLSDATWVLMDYGDIVVHVMSDEARAFYAIERLWSDAQIVDWGQVA